MNLSLLIYILLVSFIILAMLASSYLGQRHHERATDAPFESGVWQTGFIPKRFPSNFYLVAVFFVIFDIESIFLFIWAYSAEQVGKTAWYGVFAFVTMLLVSLIYVWRKGGLAAAPKGRMAK